MKIAIIVLVLSLAALGLGSFATVRTFNESHPATQTESQWSEAECEGARSDVREGVLGVEGGILWRTCRRLDIHDCAPYNDMLQAIADNCP